MGKKQLLIMAILAASGCHPVAASEESDCTKEALKEYRTASMEIQGSLRATKTGKAIAQEALDKYIEDKWLECKMKENHNDSNN